MGITSQLKEISLATFERLKKEPALVEAFLSAKWLPESTFWETATHWPAASAELIKRNCETAFFRIPSLREQFVSEWETPDLYLNKNFQQLTFLLAGYIPGYIFDRATIPEIKANTYLMAKAKGEDFFPFLVIDNSRWDGLPLVNAIGAGAEIGYSTGYEAVRYLLPDEITRILNGLVALGEQGFQSRYLREADRDEPISWIDWAEEEILEWLTDYYNEMLNYYQKVSADRNAMLVYLS